MRLAERMREAIAAIVIDVEGRGQVRPTASFGLAEGLPALTVTELLEQADQCLYRAKRSGRNRVELSPSMRPGIALMDTAARA
nr:diguanylate cyclase [Maricaulis sp.]